jgi:hypothetical protein
MEALDRALDAVTLDAAMTGKLGKNGIGVCLRAAEHILGGERFLWLWRHFGN